ncbi:NADH:ubiquinone oxidoreductase subunit NDUFA12 [Roseospira visakhapatnamensis]|uniref:NADH:ubiquinone oxidoreductase subunit n=1 Tax=Roseospira visakhapatnamensis TaxID=390880 RepID=A0A7W6W9M9_9PROT|nr:NADH:ubiquinone oxidoreductase subunit NDUFA12 [Roseospira visakhapatnamensis]MBB4265622.1 NADH:ubiquinone oxidoreductase subunit [Roseospira visakhapatnamensis]
MAFSLRVQTTSKTANTPMTIGTWLHTLFSGTRVGKDPAGNVYYRERRAPAGRRAKRWVMYKGEAEASAVPPEWHAWLHHTVEDPLPSLDKPWAKPHVPNLSGTADAYVPAGDERRGGARRAASGDYQAWTPGG